VVAVLHLSKGLELGGAERLIVDCVLMSTADDVHYSVAYQRPSLDHLASPLVGAGVPVTCLGAESDADLRWVLRLRRLIRHERFDVIHSHMAYSSAFARLVASTLPAARRPAIVHTYHGEWKGTHPIVRLLDRATFRQLAKSLAVSESARSTLPVRAARDTEVLVHGVPVERLRAARAQRTALRTELGLGADEIVVTSIANLREPKGYDVLLDAASIVAAADQRVHFLAVGSGPLAAKLEARRDALGLDARFSLLGRRDDVHQILAASDIFVLASRHEGFPIALMEAIAAGLPAVATRVGGATACIEPGRNGLLVDTGNASALAEAVLALAEAPDLRRSMADQAAVIGDQFDITRAISALEAIYRDVGAGPARAHTPR
jgi:glycosyltransferase involved in cell wall biosynthesis